MQRDDGQSPGSVLEFDPPHPVGGRFNAGELDRFPALGSVGRRNQVEYGAALFRVSGVPFAADGDLAFSIAINVLGGDADVVSRGQIFGEHVL